ncbi:ROK family transcriptional regulator [Bowmanella sp. Y26]|uniref:ROK family transcriptional regulator n=1 Tax=Bowmanella yangjiangensis TaxID=2811230 RepID=UPI001BDD863B|nr:ROK family transcriptional regulator [Bowmanella yangjiangensis]MBT1062314.1 ROK family transcriptional regulator [Bowmanella yangjiangensis]
MANKDFSRDISSIESQLNSSHKKVIEHIYKNQRATRAEIAKFTGLSNQTLTRLTKQLISLNLISEHSKISGMRGQPATYLRINEGVLATVGVVFEHDRVVVVAEDLNRRSIQRKVEQGHFQSAELAVSKALEMLDNLFNELDENFKVMGIGISVSGFFTNVSGRICSQQDPQGWAKIDFQSVFARNYNLPCYVENDGNAASIGFALSPEGATLQSFFLILFTLDIGGGFVFEGKIVDGAFGNAGEIAAIVNSGPNAIRPTIGSLTRYLESRWNESIEMEKVETRYIEGDTNIQSWLTACIESLKFPLKAIQSLLDPEAIIFTGRLPKTLQQHLAENAVITGPSYGDVYAPTPRIKVIDEDEILERGVTATPAFYFFNR